ncbi:MAG: nitroreductase family protein [Thermoplasmata archaeon]
MNRALEVMKKRRSVRKYSDKTVPEEKINSLLLSAMWAPTARNRRHCEFIVVRDNEMKKRLAYATEYSYMCGDAAAVIVILGKRDLTQKWIEDCSAAATHILLAAVDESLGACWVQIRDSRHENMDAQEYIREILSIPSNYGVLCMIAIGYPAEDKEEHSMKEYDEKRVHFERF